MQKKNKMSYLQSNGDMRKAAATIYNERDNGFEKYSLICVYAVCSHLSSTTVPFNRITQRRLSFGNHLRHTDTPIAIGMSTTHAK